MCEFTGGLSGRKNQIFNSHQKQHNFWTDPNGIPSRETEMLLSNNPSGSIFSEVQKSSSQQQPSPGCQNNQPLQQSFLGLDFTESPFEEVPGETRETSIESIGLAIQDDYFAEFDKEIASTPENVRFCNLWSDLNDSSIELTAEKGVSSRTKSLMSESTISPIIV